MTLLVNLKKYNTMRFLWGTTYLPLNTGLLDVTDRNLPFGLGKLHSSTKYSSLKAVSNICPKMKEHERQNACNAKRDSAESVLQSLHCEVLRSISGLFTLSGTDSDSDFKADGYIVLCRNCSHCTDSKIFTVFEVGPWRSSLSLALMVRCELTDKGGEFT